MCRNPTATGTAIAPYDPKRYKASTMTRWDREYWTDLAFCLAVLAIAAATWVAGWS